ncbi:MAG: ABC transporter substrate-binding protein, partial [Acidimicrobiia bacterium]
MRRLVPMVALVLASAGFPIASAGAGEQKPKFTGDPITVMTIGEFAVAAVGSENPELAGAVKARARAINKAGGLEDTSGDTHNLNVIACNTDLDPNRSEQCARDAVDEGVVAVIGQNSVNGAQIFPALEESGIPSIGNIVFQPIDASSPMAFPLTPGIPGVFAALPQVLGEAGATDISYIVSDIGATTAAAVLFLDQGTELTGAQKGPEVLVPADAADLAPYVATGTADPVDGTVAFLIGEIESTLIRQIAESGFDGPVSTQAGLLTESILDDAGDAADGLLVVGPVVPFTNTKVKGIKMFRKDMAAYDDSLALNDSAVNSWLATYVFEQVAETLPTIDRDSVRDAMGRLVDFDTLGI